MLKNRIMVGAVAVSAALVPIAGVSALSAGPASAAKTKTITCTKGSGNINTKIQLTGCNGNTGTKTMKLSARLLDVRRNGHVGERQDDQLRATHARYRYALHSEVVYRRRLNRNGSSDR